MRDRRLRRGPAGVRRNSLLTKMFSKKSLLAEIARGVEFPPLTVTVQPGRSGNGRGANGTLVEIQSAGERFEFCLELCPRSTPRAFEQALNDATRAGRGRARTLVFAPYLRDAQLQELERRKLSGLDLCGNGVICLPERLLVYRTGNPNRFPDSAPTRFAYRGVTSLVGRVFLCRRSFRTLADIRDAIAERGGRVALSTVSKALKRLESDVIVDRDTDGVRLRQPQRLLDQLAESYREPSLTRTVTLRSDCPLNELTGIVKEDGPRLVYSGRSSVGAYAVMGQSDWPVMYTTDVTELLSRWKGRVEETVRFVDVEVRQTDDPNVYFDMRREDTAPYASPVQVYLELMAGDKRDQEVAAQVKQFILKELDSN